jgi:hypothetical protein
MGIHWYALSVEILDVDRAFQDVEQRCDEACDAHDRAAVKAAMNEREVLYVRQREVFAECDRRGFAVTVGSIGQWPAHVLQHVHALGPAEPDRRVLDLIGWGSDYYIENLRDARVPIKGFSQPLDYLRISPPQACALGEEILHYAARARKANQVRSAREAGIWLYLWGSLNCHVEAGQ